jgi:hypothetical protein
VNLRTRSGGERVNFSDIEAAAALERRMFRPTYGIEGPHARKPIRVPFYIFLAAALFLALMFGAIADRLGLI